MSRKTVLVLGGGPDAEREVSLVSSKFVAEALQRGGEFDVNYQIIDRANLQQLRALAGDVVFPVLHGGWGEGGPLQDLLDQDRRPYVGCRGQAARVAMDKMAT
ncbi:MAG: D-alanine--D-alanine ligase, partial [Phycisphaerae bacterium]